MWIFLSLTCAGLLAVISLADKRLLDYHLPSLSTLYLWVALTLAVYVVCALALNGAPRDASWLVALIALGSGLSLGAGYALVFVGLKAGEASRAIAISQIHPIFVALLATLILGERLLTVQWSAILLVVLGVILVSLPAWPPGRAAFRPSVGFWALMTAGLCLGAGYFAAKVALVESSFATVFIYQQTGTMLAFLPFGRPRVWGELLQALGSRTTVALLLIGEGALPLLFLAGSLYATYLGPVSLVSAFLSTTPMFVFILATLISLGPRRLLDETVTRSALAVKFIAIAMIVAGVGALSLF